jgi:hypothetical protein
MVMVRLLFSALISCAVLHPAWAACSVGNALLQFQLAVQPADGSRAPISVRSVNLLSPGQKLIYAPIGKLDEEDRKGKVTLVLVPVGANEKLTVLKPQSAGSSTEWEVPFLTQVVALVYGPSGLDTKKVSSLVKKDQELVEQLADYASQTEKTEQLLETISEWDQSPTRTDNVNAAIAGFSSTYGGSGPQMNWDASKDQQAATLMRALNPALATYDPLAQEPRQRMQQSAMLAASVAGLFFGGPVGLAAGGAAMFVNMNTMLFPDTDFRSAFVQEAAPYTMSLCAKRQKSKNRTRPAYLWAVRIPNAPTPSLTIGQPAHMLTGTASKVKVHLNGNGDWRDLKRAREWQIVSVDEQAIPVKVRTFPDEESLEVDLKDTGQAAGAYKLSAKWDWDRFEAQGDLHVHEMDQSAPQLSPRSKDQLIAGTGRVPVLVTGCDFEFVKKVELKNTEGTIIALEYSLPKGPGAGPQHELTAYVDVKALSAGHYTLSLSMTDGKSREIPLRILPPHPTLTALPLRLNLGEKEQAIEIKGEGIERIESYQCDQAQVTMRSPQQARVQLGEGVRKGDRLDLLLQVEGVQEPVRVPDAMEVVGPRPRIAAAQASLPGELGIDLAEKELPAGSFASFSIQIEPVDSPPTVHLACAEEELAIAERSARAGEHQEGIRLRNAGANTLFLSLDPGSVGQAGCTLTATVTTEDEGSSEAYNLGSIVRLPRIESFELTDEQAGEESYFGYIRGEELELIEKVGWSPASGIAVSGLPAPVAAGGPKQSLKVTLPWPSPSPHAPLHIWLRGEPVGRMTTARY